MTTVRDVTYQLLREFGLTIVFGNVGSTEETWSSIWTRSISKAVESRKMLSAPRPGLSACLPVQHPNAFQSWKDSHQIDNGEYQNPDDVERVPEQGEAMQTAHHDVLKTSQ